MPYYIYIDFCSGQEQTVAQFSRIVLSHIFESYIDLILILKIRQFFKYMLSHLFSFKMIMNKF